MVTFRMTHPAKAERSMSSANHAGNDTSETLLPTEALSVWERTRPPGSTIVRVTGTCIETLLMNGAASREGEKVRLTAPRSRSVPREDGWAIEMASPPSARVKYSLIGGFCVETACRTFSCEIRLMPTIDLDRAGLRGPDGPIPVAGDRGQGGRVGGEGAGEDCLSGGP